MTQEKEINKDLILFIGMIVEKYGEEAFPVGKNIKQLLERAYQVHQALLTSHTRKIVEMCEEKVEKMKNKINDLEKVYSRPELKKDLDDIIEGIKALSIKSK